MNQKGYNIGHCGKKTFLPRNIPPLRSSEVSVGDTPTPPVKGAALNNPAFLSEVNVGDILTPLVKGCALNNPALR